VLRYGLEFYFILFWGGEREKKDGEGRRTGRGGWDVTFC